MKKYLVKVDSSEKKGWWFEPSEYCEGSIISNLDTADYTLQGAEDIFVIERKKTTGELAINITESRFTRELERLAKFKYPYIVCEFDLADMINFPINSGIPEDIWPELKVTSNFLKSKILDFSINYGIHVIYAGNYGKKISEDLFKKIWQMLR